MVGKPHSCPVALLQGGQHPQIGLLVRGRIGRGAVHQHQLDLRYFPHSCDRRIDLLPGGPTGREQDGTPLRRHVAQQGQMGQIPGGDLVGRHLQFFEQIRTGPAKRGRKEENPLLLAVRRQVPELIKGEGFLLEGRKVRVSRSHQLLGQISLELHGRRTRMGRGPDHLLGQLQVPAVIPADLGDHQGDIADSGKEFARVHVHASCSFR